ncbi:MAG: AraC family transcriptional regulator, partial [Trueperaceae bacterium]|nr:AraC family transcriptional regulator [Trueperaceae bacterium]
PIGKMRIRLEPAHKIAYVRITKAQVAFPDILAAYDAVEDYLVKKGIKFDAPREIFFADWDKTGDNEPVCDVAFPFKA